MTTLHPGSNEIEWLADLKPLAERIGEEVLGFEIRWAVEAKVGHGSRDRSDVRVEKGDGTVLFTGEAKRPDTPEGVHPLVTSEVNDSVEKAQLQGAKFSFTTNFFQIAFLNAGPGLHAQPLLRLQGDLIPLVDQTRANQVGWWKAMALPERRAETAEGLRVLFERYRLSIIGDAPALSVDSLALDYFQAITDALLGPIAQAFDSAYERVSPSIHQQALSAGLDLESGQDRQYLVAQGIAEVLTATLFHRLLRDYFDQLEPLLGGTVPKTPQLLAQSVTSGLFEAVSITGDYKPILVISDIAQWVIAEAPASALAHWMALFDFTERLDLHLISSDILGTIFERLISPERRHDLGQHYTQPRLARAMAKWGVRDSDTVVIDPACGAGTFLVETYKIHQEKGVPHDEALKRNLGNDIDPFAVHLASINLATRRIKKGLNHPLVRQGDAFTLSPGQVNMLHIYATSDGEAEDFVLPKADLVIANPPYGRNAENELSYMAHLQGHGLNGIPKTTGVNLAAWFVLLGAILGKPDARMAFVLPSGVLQNDNLGSWRAWLRRKYDLTVWHTESDVWFSDARVAACVLLMEPRSANSNGNGKLHFVNVLKPVDGELHWLDTIPSPSVDAEVRDLSDLEGGDDILIPGTMPEVLRKFSALDRVTSVGQVENGTAVAGQKLGHKVFRLEDRDPDSKAIVRSVSGLGAEFQLNRKYLTPLLTGAKEINSGQPKLGRFWLLTAPKKRPSPQSSLAVYLKLAESQGTHLEPSVKARKPWWHLVAKPVNVAVAMNEQFRHQVAWLDPGAVVTNNFNTFAMPKKVDAEIAAACLASAFGGVAAQYASGEIGCEGVRRILLSHFEVWPIVDPAAPATTAARQEVRQAYQTYRAFKASEYDEMPANEAAALRRLTIAVASLALGGESGDAVALAEEAISCARETTVRRRQREAQALGGRTRTTQANGPTLPRRVRSWCQGSHDVERLVALLTSGPKMIKLRTVEDIDSPQLFAISDFDDHPEEERALVEALGEGFEAAFPSPDDSPDDLKELVSLAISVVTEATADLLPAAPAVENPGHETWLQMKEQMLAMLRKTIQAESRRILA